MGIQKIKTANLYVNLGPDIETRDLENGLSIFGVGGILLVATTLGEVVLSGRISRCGFEV